MGLVRLGLSGRKQLELPKNRTSTNALRAQEHSCQTIAKTPSERKILVQLDRIVHFLGTWLGRHASLFMQASTGSSFS